MVITNSWLFFVFAWQIYGIDANAFTSINIILLSFLTSQLFPCYSFEKSCRCVFNTSLIFAFDFIQLPLV